MKINKSTSEQSRSEITHDNTTAQAIPEDIAAEVLALLKASFQQSHELIKANVSFFDGVDPEFYAQWQARFEKMGFVWLCDLEDKTISDQGKLVTFSRFMRNLASNVLVTFYYIPPLQAGFIEYQSFLSDGRLVVSTTVPESNKVADWPIIVSQYYPIDIDESTLYQSHLGDVLQICDQGTSILEINSFNTLVTLNNAFNRHKYDYLKSIGWVTREYLLNQCFGDERLAAKVYAIIQQKIR